VGPNNGRVIQAFMEVVDVCLGALLHGSDPAHADMQKPAIQGGTA
jgi:hypothetical protein